MIVQIEDKSLEQILQTVVKEEIETLARELMKNREVKFVLWCWLLTNFRVHGIQGAGIQDSDVDDRLRSIFNQIGVPMPAHSGGGGGGGTSGEKGDDPSGGGSTEPPITAGACKQGTAPPLIKAGGDSKKTAD